MKERMSRGFTLIELLVVIAILAVLAAALVAAINPFEQIKKAQDANVKNAAVEFTNASIRYFATHDVLPWNASVSCLTEVGTGNVLSNTPSCLSELIKDGELKAGFVNAQGILNKVYVSACGNTAIVCFNPLSLAQNNSLETKYDQFGKIKPGCPESNGKSATCYWCTESCPSGSQDDQGGQIVDGGSLPIPTPTLLPTPTPTRAPTPTPTPTLASTPTPHASHSIYPTQPGEMMAHFYQNDGVFLVSSPNLPGETHYWLDLSLDPNFSPPTIIGNGGVVTQHGNTFLHIAWGGDLTSQMLKDFGNVVETLPFRQPKQPWQFTPVQQIWQDWQCGKTLYWRLTGQINQNLHTPVHADLINCSAPVRFSAIDVQSAEYNQNLYNSAWDQDHDGKITGDDYMLLLFQNFLY